VVSSLVFGLLAAGAGILLESETPSRAETLRILLALIFASLAFYFILYVLQLVFICVRRIAMHPLVFQAYDRAESKVDAASDFIKALTTDFEIHSIRNNRGTVNLVFPYGTRDGVAPPQILEVVALNEATLLGSVAIESSNEKRSYARPIDRTVPDFWDDLEDRMNRDFKPPDLVVGRLYNVSPLALDKLLTILSSQQEV
jgi:hypothetical protein